MNFKEIQYVAEVERCRSFSKAAAGLNISQPALSKIVSQVEKEMGQKLFDRTTMPVSLTAAGEIFMEKAREMLRLYHELNVQMEQFGSKSSHLLRIGIASYHGMQLLPYILKKFSNEYPDTEIVIREADSYNRLRELVHRGEVDFAVSLGRRPSEEFQTIVITQESTLFVVPEEYDILPRECKTSRKIHIKQLGIFRDTPFVLLRKGLPHHYFAIMCCNEAGFTPKKIYECSSLEDVTAMVSVGFGVTFMLNSAVRMENQRLNLSYYFLEGNNFYRGTFIIYDKHQVLSGRASAFVEMYRDYSKGFEGRTNKNYVFKE